MEDFYDGYVVNAIIDAAYNSVATKKWEPIELPIWRGQTNAPRIGITREFDDDHLLIKKEKMPDGTTKLILKNKHTNQITQQITK